MYFIYREKSSILSPLNITAIINAAITAPPILHLPPLKEFPPSIEAAIPSISKSKKRPELAATTTVLEANINPPRPAARPQKL